MKTTILSLLISTMFSCSESKFCGTERSRNEVENLNGKVEGTGFTLGVDLSFEVARKLGENKDLKLEVIYSTTDTIILNIFNIPGESFAKEMSCIVMENNIIRNYKFAFVTYNWQEESKSFKY